jgi:hypothetical protein
MRLCKRSEGFSVGYLANHAAAFDKSQLAVAKSPVRQQMIEGIGRVQVDT